MFRAKLTALHLNEQGGTVSTVKQDAQSHNKNTADCPAPDGARRDCLYRQAGCPES